MKKLVFYSTLIVSLMANGILTRSAKADEFKQHQSSMITSGQIASISEFEDNFNSNFSSDNAISENNLNKVIGITGLAIGTGVIAYHLSKNNQSTLANFSHTNTDTLLLDRVSPKLRQQLLRLINNKQTANRLLTGTLAKYGDHSPNWLAEKVIYDLQRDRR
jgi:hypothetical protein